VVVLLVATEVGFVVVVVIVAPTAAVIALGLALAAALEQTLQSEQLLAERAGLVCFGVRLVPGVLLLLAALRSAVCRWWSARVRHLARPCCLRYFTCILHWYNGTWFAGWGEMFKFDVGAGDVVVLVGGGVGMWQRWSWSRTSRLQESAPASHRVQSEGIARSSSTIWLHFSRQLE
jgi:hypothetical protein